MPEPTILIALKSVASQLLKLAPWVWKRIPRNTPVGKAIRATVDRYSTRLPDLELALEQWILSDGFQSQVESLEGGSPLTEAEVSHVDAFIKTTGLSLGTTSLEAARECLGVRPRNSFRISTS
jgi:hypothetical protein